jgi:hypothetical protein
MEEPFAEILKLKLFLMDWYNAGLALPLGRKAFKSVSSTERLPMDAPLRIKPNAPTFSQLPMKMVKRDSHSFQLLKWLVTHW